MCEEISIVFAGVDQFSYLSAEKAWGSGPAGLVPGISVSAGFALFLDFDV